jgi:triacylglycerol lipase
MSTTPSSIPEEFPGKYFGGFNHKRASELLQLIDEAHKRYNDIYPPSKARWWEIWNRSKRKLRKKEFDHKTTAHNGWRWQDAIEPSIVINGQEFEVLPESNLIFTQLIWYLPHKRFKREVPFGFIARCKDTSDICIVFRGTMNLGEWISNFKILQIPVGILDVLNWRHPGNGKTELQDLYGIPGEAHLGFYRTYTRPKQNWFIDRLFLREVRSLCGIVESVLEANCPPTSTKRPQIYVTGHSLGGALATLAAQHVADLIGKNIISAQHPILYTFASPRVFDASFANGYSTETYRIFNSEDIVPKIPLLISVGISLYAKSVSDYKHVGIPICFTEQKGTIQGNHIMPTYLEAFRVLPQA